MSAFIIEGGHPLQGTITPQGAKNEALQVICATLLTCEPVTIENIPNIRDVNNLIQLLKDIGVKVEAPSNLPRLGEASSASVASPSRGRLEGASTFTPISLSSWMRLLTSRMLGWR